MLRVVDTAFYVCLFFTQYRLVIGGEVNNTCLTPEHCHLETVS